MKTTNDYLPPQGQLGPSESGAGDPVDLSKLPGRSKAAVIGDRSQVAQTAPASPNDGPNVIRTPQAFPPETWVLGTAIPGVSLKGAQGVASYFIWTHKNTLSPRDDKFTVYFSLALPPRMADAAGFAPMIANILTQMGIAKTSNAASAIAGSIFGQHQRIEALLNTPAFKRALPLGASVVPAIVATAPLDSLGNALDNGKTEIGLSLTIIMPTSAGKNAIRPAFFINSRQNVQQLIRGENPEYSVNFGGKLIGIKIPKVGKRVNFGPSWRTTLNSPGSGPWELHFADKKSVALPRPMAMIANALFDRDAAIGNADFGELTRLIEKIPTGIREQLGNALNLADTTTSMTALATVYRALGMSGPGALFSGGATVLVGKSIESYSEWVQKNAMQSFLKGRFSPGLALPAGLHRGAHISKNNTDILKATIELAIANGASVPELKRQWEDVLDGKLNGGLTGTDLLEARLAAANLLGQGEEALSLYRELNLQLGRPGDGTNIMAENAIAPAARNFGIDQFAAEPKTRVLEGERIAGQNRSLKWVGGREQKTGIDRQGRLLSAKNRSWQDVYWLQGQNKTGQHKVYWLRDTNDQLITNQDAAIKRAREMITHSGATQLFPLKPTDAKPGGGSSATLANTRLVDGIQVVEPTTFVEDIGAEVGKTGRGLQGALYWANTPTGERVFWLQGQHDNYLLRDGTGQLIRSQGPAIERAVEMIRYGTATQLKPLKLDAQGNDDIRGVKIDGVTIQGTPTTVRYVGVESVGLQGLLKWARQPGGQVVFWLEGKEQTAGSGNRQNYVLYSPDGSLVRSQGEAIERAQDYIIHGRATELDHL